MVDIVGSRDGGGQHPHIDGAGGDVSGEPRVSANDVTVAGLEVRVGGRRREVGRIGGIGSWFEGGNVRLLRFDGSRFDSGRIAITYESADPEGKVAGVDVGGPSGTSSHSGGVQFHVDARGEHAHDVGLFDPIAALEDIIVFVGDGTGNYAQVPTSGVAHGNREGHLRDGEQLQFAVRDGELGVIVI